MNVLPAFSGRAARVSVAAAAGSDENLVVLFDLDL